MEGGLQQPPLSPVITVRARDEPIAGNLPGPIEERAAFVEDTASIRIWRVRLGSHTTMALTGPTRISTRSPQGGKVRKNRSGSYSIGRACPSIGTAPGAWASRAQMS
jgi:hypothetical protein